MSTTDSQTDEESPYRRDNWFYEETEGDEDLETGHAECSGTDPAEAIMFRELSQLAGVRCARSLEELGEEIELSEPELYLPKTKEQGSRELEYGQHAQPRRVNEETGWINWGETTSTAVPEVNESTYTLAVENYLAKRGVSVTNVEQWLQYAGRLFHDPQYNSKEALVQFIHKKRAYDRGEIQAVPE